MSTAADGDRDLLDFVVAVCEIRREHDVFRRGRFFVDGELQWLRPDGAPMQSADWSNPGARAIAVATAGGALLMNAWWDPLTFHLPGDGGWAVEIDTADPAGGRTASGTIELPGRSLVLLSAQR